MKEIDTPKKCSLCEGQGKVWHKSHNREFSQDCPQCKGSGDQEDRLHKVMATPKPDLLK